MNDIDRQLESIHSARRQLKELWGQHYELGALVNTIPLLEELRELRKTKGKVPIATIKFSKKDMQEIVDKKMQEIEVDIQSTRNAAIDEFVEKLKYELKGNIIPDKEKFTYSRKKQEQICHQNTTLERAIKYVDYIAEQMKGSGNDA